MEVKGSERLIEAFPGLKGGCQLGVDDGVDGGQILFGGPLEGLCGPIGPVRIIGEEIDQDIGIDQEHGFLILASDFEDLIRAHAGVGAAADLSEALLQACASIGGRRSDEDAVFSRGEFHLRLGVEAVLLPVTSGDGDLAFPGKFHEYYF